MNLISLFIAVKYHFGISCHFLTSYEWFHHLAATVCPLGYDEPCVSTENFKCDQPELRSFLSVKYMLDLEGLI